MQEGIARTAHRLMGNPGTHKSPKAWRMPGRHALYRHVAQGENNKLQEPIFRRTCNERLRHTLACSIHAEPRIVDFRCRSRRPRYSGSTRTRTPEGAA